MMTNERAIELLHRISDSQFDGEYGDERREALDMAVRALEGDGDTISRKMAIDAMRKLQKWNVMREDYKNVGFLYDDVMFTLEKLPSAQPEITEDDVKEYCRKRCLIVVTSDLYDEMTRRWASEQPETHDKRTETHACDLIGRQEAIDQLHQSYNLLDAEQRLEDLPSAQQDDRLNKIAELVNGTINHFDRDDAMDLLYQIKEVLK